MEIGVSVSAAGFKRLIVSLFELDTKKEVAVKTLKFTAGIDHGGIAFRRLEDKAYLVTVSRDLGGDKLEEIDKVVLWKNGYIEQGNITQGTKIKD